MNKWILFFYVMIGIIVALSSNSIVDTVITIIPIFICVISIGAIEERQTLQDRNYRTMKNVLKAKAKENKK